MKKKTLSIIKNLIPVILVVSLIFTVFTCAFAFAEGTESTGDTVTTGATDTETIGTVSPTATPDPGTTTAQQQPWWQWVIMIAIYAAIFGLLYLVLIRPQQKKRKQEEAMRSSLMLGDMITTIGGIVGKVVNIHDDDVTIETSIDRSLITFKNWAIRDIKKAETDEDTDSKNK